MESKQVVVGGAHC